MALPGQQPQTFVTTADANILTNTIPVNDLGTVQVGQTLYWNSNIVGTVFSTDVGNSTINTTAPLTYTIPSGSTVYASADDFAVVTLINLELGDETYYLSDAYTPLTFTQGNATLVYTEMGAFMSVSSFTEDYKSTEGTVTIELSGIPNKTKFINIIQDSKIKGGRATVYRSLYSTTDYQALGETYIRFAGLISNYNLVEDTDVIAGRSTNTIVLDCTSFYTNLARTIAGQKTNGSDRRRYYPTDETFDNVKNIRGIPEFG